MSLGLLRLPFCRGVVLVRGHERPRIPSIVGLGLPAHPLPASLQPSQPPEFFDLGPSSACEYSLGFQKPRLMLSLASAGPTVSSHARRLEARLERALARPLSAARLAIRTRWLSILVGGGERTAVVQTYLAGLFAFALPQSAKSVRGF